MDLGGAAEGGGGRPGAAAAAAAKPSPHRLGQAAVLCRHLAGEKQLPIYEVFPFWTTDEVNEMRLNEYRRRMERMAAKGGNGGGQ